MFCFVHFTFFKQYIFFIFYFCKTSRLENNDHVVSQAGEDKVNFNPNSDRRFGPRL